MALVILWPSISTLPDKATRHVMVHIRIPNHTASDLQGACSLAAPAEPQLRMYLTEWEPGLDSFHKGCMPSVYLLGTYFVITYLGTRPQNL